jgi:heparosan-N-sulfate-glucuronate 5-epimerase
MTVKKTLEHWNHRFIHWYRMFAGTSYYHRQQNLGRVFVPGELNGYFNDLTGKADWMGQTDQDGLPVSSLSTGKSVHFPILLCQKALGHWDNWLIHERPEDSRQFLNIADWLQRTQDSAGGWDTWGSMGKPQQYRYSAMTQGQAMSVMSRAFKLTRRPEFERAGASALELLRRPIQEEGVCCYEGQNVFLEEFPSARRDTVLNGWIFALFGVHDYLLVFPDHKGREFYASTCDCLTRSLGTYDAGYWSYYSSGTKRLASPFYHKLHLSQLQALRQVTEAPAVGSILDAWTRCEKSPVCKSRAVVVKGFQKLREPQHVRIVK